MGALLVLWLRPVPAEMEPFFTGPNNLDYISGLLRDEDRSVSETVLKLSGWTLRIADSRRMASQ
jgi:hypothetical protein